MKRFLLLVVLSVITTVVFSVPVQEMMFQGTYLGANRVYSDGLTQSFTGAGFGFVNFVGGSVGLLSDVSVMIPITTGADMTRSDYDALTYFTDIMLGIGFRTDLAFADLLFGAGVHFNGIALMSNDNWVSPSPYLSYVLGAGVSATGIYELSPGFNLNITFRAGYDFMELMREPELAVGVDFTRGMSVGVGLGLGIVK